jgi:hypothetical protein
MDIDTNGCGYKNRERNPHEPHEIVPFTSIKQLLRKGVEVTNRNFGVQFRFLQPAATSSLVKSPGNVRDNSGPPTIHTVERARLQS